MKTIEKFKTSLEAYEKLDVDYKDIIEYIINNPDLNKEDIDSPFKSNQIPRIAKTNAQ